MHLYELPLVFSLIGLALYAVLAGADFGAGFWQLFAGRGSAGVRVRDHAHNSMAPVWEANHVWLIFVLTVVWTAYPTAFGSIASTLSIPLFIAAVGIIFRGGAYALRAGSPTPGELRAIDVVTALASIITPFALGAAVGAIASGQVPVGNAAGDLFSSWLNPTSILVGVLAVATAAYLAAVYLAADAVRLREPDLEGYFRTRAPRLRDCRGSNRARRPGRAAFRRPCPLQRSGHGRWTGCAGRLNPRRARHPDPGLEAELRAGALQRQPRGRRDHRRMGPCANPIFLLGLTMEAAAPPTLSSSSSSRSSSARRSCSPHWPCSSGSCSAASSATGTETTSSMRPGKAILSASKPAPCRWLGRRLFHRRDRISRHRRGWLGPRHRRHSVVPVHSPRIPRRRPADTAGEEI